MFSSNQIIKISGELRKEDILNALKFAMKAYGEEPFTRNEKPVAITYQETNDGKYCLGFGEREGWKNFPFSYNLEIIAEIIIDRLSNQKINDFGYDGSYHKGFIMENIEQSFSHEENGIINPFFGIVSFKPFTCFYAK